jgi:hypothetical protein
VLKDGKVWMQKKCPRHGNFEVEISSDADYYMRSLSYTKPGTMPLHFSTRVEHGCPQDCGLCEEHLQHTCSPIFEINDICDLTCPVCIVRNQQRYGMTMEQFKRGVKARVVLRFWPTWPATGTHAAVFSLIGFTREYARMEECKP